jgi:electron transport complex protein RnfD
MDGVIDVIPFSNLFIGNVAGSIGTVSVLAVLIGGAYLLYRRIITWHIPVFFVLSAWVFAYLYAKGDPDMDPDYYLSFAHFHVLAGWIMLGAFFLAPEKGSSPVTIWGMILYGISCGCITMIVRIWGTYVEGVHFAILLANGLTPLLDRIRPRVIGRVKEIA